MSRDSICVLLLHRCVLEFGCYPGPMELIFEIRDAEEGVFYARALGQSIFTEGNTWEELRANVLEAVSLHCEISRNRPRLVQLHYVRDELIPLEAARNCRVTYRANVRSTCAGTSGTQ